MEPYARTDRALALMPGMPGEERRRLLLRLLGDQANARAQVEHILAQARVLADAQADRPLTAAEAERALALNGESTRLWYLLGRLGSELAALQRPG